MIIGIIIGVVIAAGIGYCVVRSFKKQPPTPVTRPPGTPPNPAQVGDNPNLTPDQRQAIIDAESQISKTQ